MPSGIVITEERMSPEWDVGSEWKLLHWPLAQGIPDPARFADVDYVIAVGSFSRVSYASELGGALRLFAEAGTTVVFLYPGNIEGADKALFDQLLPESPGFHYSNPATPTLPIEATFSDYLTAYGRSGTRLAYSLETTVPLGGIPDQVEAFAQSAGQGVIYVLPYFVGDFPTSYNAVIGSLLRAVEGHQSGSDDVLPEYVAEFRLPGEEKALERATNLNAETQQAEAQVAHLRHFRHLLGTASGPTLEALTLEALNLVLEDTDASAEDREDLGVEDFWLVGPSSDLALAEVKGIGGHVKRQNVNQVDNHRDQHELNPEEMPGLLVVNVFRNTDGPEAEQRSLPVSPDVVAHARRHNVLVLRTCDLYYLLHQRLGGASIGSQLLDALNGGGGWLEASADTCTLHT